MLWGCRLAEFDVYAVEGAHDIFPVQLRLVAYFYASDDPAALYVRRRPKNRHVASERSFNLLREWLRICFKEHEFWPGPEALRLPTRVLDVEPDRPRLYISDQGKTGLYLALSYCWGGPQLVKTTVATIEDMKRSINCEDLPKILQDAIVTTRKLRLRYLWADSLCTIQDDPVDMAKEIAMMPQVYTEAYVTISAECAKT